DLERRGCRDGAARRGGYVHLDGRCGQEQRARDALFVRKPDDDLLYRHACGPGRARCAPAPLRNVTQSPRRTDILAEMARGIGARLACGAFALAVLTAASAGRADNANDANHEFRATYRAHTGCPDPDQFAGEVLARARAARLATEGQAAYLFDVDVVRTESGSRGRLEVMDVDGAKSPREVDGPSCSEAVASLALIPAPTLDPSA